MSERTDGGLKGGRENFVQFFGEKDVVCVNESSEGFRGVVYRLTAGIGRKWYAMYSL